jgi:hypothetical protein
MINIHFALVPDDALLALLTLVLSFSPQEISGEFIFGEPAMLGCTLVLISQLLISFEE